MFYDNNNKCNRWDSTSIVTRLSTNFQGDECHFMDGYAPSCECVHNRSMHTNAIYSDILNFRVNNIIQTKTDKIYLRDGKSYIYL